MTYKGYDAQLNKELRLKQRYDWELQRKGIYEPPSISNLKPT